MNRVELVGTLVRDLEMRYLPSGLALVEISLAVNGTRYDSTARETVVTTLYTTVSVWGWAAEKVANDGVTRGDSVHVLGELEQREIEKPGGGKEKKTRVVATVVTPVRVKATPVSQGRPASSPQQSQGQGGAQGGDPWLI